MRCAYSAGAYFFAGPARRSEVLDASGARDIGRTSPPTASERAAEAIASRASLPSRTGRVEGLELVVVGRVDLEPGDGSSHGVSSP